jgi:hypothetical protein
MTVKRWENWLHMLRLKESLEDYGLADPEWQKSQGFFTPIKNAVLEDGHGIDFEDKAVDHFLRMLDINLSDPEMSLRVLFERVTSNFFLKFMHQGPHGYDNDALDRLMALREAPGGWEQLDRVIMQISGRETLSGIVDRKFGTLITHPDDPGLGGNTCFSIGVLTYYDGTGANPYQALASEPKYAMALIEQVLTRFDRTSDPWDCDYKKPTEIWIELNAVPICTVPLKCRSGNELPYEGVVDKDGLACFSVTEPQWRDFSWKKHDLKLMNAFANAAPADVKRYIKGSFLTDELGA